MSYECYIDVFFLENLILNYLVLVTAGNLLGKKRHHGRLFLAAGLGSLGSCLLLLDPVRRIPGIQLIWLLALGTLMGMTAFHLKGGREILRSLLTMGMTTLLLGGILNLGLEAFPGKSQALLIPFAFFGVLCFRTFFWIYGRLQFQKCHYYDVTVGYQGKTVTVRALRDTGNQLKDPLTGKCVSILSARTAEPFLEAGAKLYYIPFRTIGKENGLLPGFVADYMKIGQEQEYRQIERPVIALSPEPVNREGRYEMILPHLFFNE